MQFNFYSLGFALGALAIVYLLRLVYRNKRLVPYIEFKLVLWGCLLAELCMFAAMSSSDLGFAYIAHEVKFIGVSMLAPFMYVFCHKLNGSARKSYKRTYILLSIVPALTLIGIATNSLHHLFCVSYSGDLAGSQVYITVERGPLFFAYSVYNLLVFGATVLLQFLMLRKLPRGHRISGYFLLAALASNLGVIMSGVFELSKYGDEGIMIAPLVATLMYIGIIIKPTIVMNAANRITVENMKSCAMFFDLDKTLISANEAARETFGITDNRYGFFTEYDFFTRKLGIEYTECYAEPEFCFNNRFFQIDDHLLADDNGITCGRAIVLTDVTGLRNTVNSMEYALNHDSLTGLLNKTALMRRIKAGVEAPAGFIVCSMRSMKIINNLFGHEYGDTAFKAAVKHITAACGEGAVCARYAGDMLAAILPATTEASVKEIIEDISRRLEEDTELFVPVRMWFGSKVTKSWGESAENALKAAMDDLARSKLKALDDATPLEMFIHAQVRCGIAPAAKTNMIADMCGAAGRVLGLSASELEKLDILTRIYDVGLAASPKELLTRKGHLTNEQWYDYKLHVERGCRIARMSAKTLNVAGDLLAHHECYDGRGYPNRLKGDEIPLLARILAPCAYIGEQVHDHSLSRSDALKHMQDFSGTRFDPAVVQACVTALDAQHAEGV